MSYGNKRINRMMNHTTVALVAVLAAAALVIGTLASLAFASDSSKTITKQINKQKQVLSGFVTNKPQITV